MNTSVAAAKESIADRIRTLEQRLEHRRLRLREDTEEAKSAVQVTARRWLPVAAAAGAGLAAFWLTRRSRPAAASSSMLSTLTAPFDRNAQAQRRGVRWASLLGLASTAYKFGTSPQARLLLDAIRNRRGARPRPRPY